MGGGVVINPLVVIGDNCEILHGVTIGNNTQKDRRALAKIGNNVSICAGAKIIGGVTIGDNVIIGANAVVTHDIPSNSIAGGIPAIVLKSGINPVIINPLVKHNENGEE